MLVSEYFEGQKGHWKRKILAVVVIFCAMDENNKIQKLNSYLLDRCDIETVPIVLILPLKLEFQCWPKQSLTIRVTVRSERA